jgi:RNA recognition motif-containing protein
MTNKIYVGNLSFNVSNDTLADKFAQFGTVQSAKIIMDRDTNRSKGFGFVEMATSDEAQSAISALNGTEFEGRQMNVTEAKPQAPRDNARGGFGGNRERSGGGDRGGFGGGRNRY